MGTITLALLYRADIPVDVSILVGITGLGVAVLLRRQADTWWWGLVGYVWFLGCALALTTIEFDRVDDPLLESLGELPPFWTLVASGAAVLYLSFHAWFALRFVLTVVTLVRPLGRQQARFFVSRSVEVSPITSLTFWGVLAAVGLVFWLDRVIGLGGDRFVGGLAVFVVPMLHAIPAVIPR